MVKKNTNAIINMALHLVKDLTLAMEVSNGRAAACELGEVGLCEIRREVLTLRVVQCGSSHPQ